MNMISPLTSSSSIKLWAAAVRHAGGVGFGLKKEPRSNTLQGPGGGKGKWIAADCWPDCGSKGFNKAYVEDGVVVRMGTDDTIEDSWNKPQLRACARGQSLRLWLLGADRLKYPMKRKHWEPGGGRKELRGKDEWVRISWDEALDILAGELKRVKENYGNTAILANWVGTIAARVLGLYGGFTDQWGAHSTGTWANAFYNTGFQGQWNDRFDMVETKLFILWGTNPVWSQAGLPAYSYWQAKKKGARFIAIDPFYNPTYEMLTDEWLPIRPGTDHPMLLGMIHTLLVEDDPVSNPLIDWDFLNRCTVGFDANHIPAGADPKENLRDYVLGTYDGQPKDAKWASTICGAPPDRIRWLARLLATEQHAAICTGCGATRVDNADSLPQAFIALAAMTGHLGRAHSQLGVAHHFGTNGGPQLVQGQNSRSFAKSHLRAPTILNPLAGGEMMAGSFALTPVQGCININEINTAILRGQYTGVYGEKVPIDIRMIYHAHGSRVNQLPNTLQAIEAHRKVDFVVTQNMFMNADAIYSDLVLPVTSRWERDGNVCIGYREQLLWHSKVMEPYFECQDDLWIGAELARRLGIDPKLVEPWSWKQEIFNQVADARVMNEDGKTLEPLVTITNEDVGEFAVDGVPQTGRITLKEFKEKGIYHIPREAGDNHGFVYLGDFRGDPEAYPLNTPSGKLEIHCQQLADKVNRLGWSQIRPIPTYNPPLAGYEATFRDWERRIKGDYPLQIYNVHMPRQAHSFFENTTVMRELFPHEFIMNSIDAEPRGIVNGDTVLVRSRWGKILRTVWVTPLVMPGVTILGQGARVDLDEETGIDHGGCANVLKDATPTGGGHVGWNSLMVEVEKWTGQKLRSDVEVAHIIPLAEQRA
jgi:anaerobic dimethyl sulfoxide reductase subunit A